MTIGAIIKRQHIENGIYEALRVELVRLALLPDVMLYETQAQFKAAKEALRLELQDEGKEIIDVENVNNGETRNTDELNVFVINYKGKDSSGNKNSKLVLEETTPPETPKEQKRFARYKVQPPENLQYEIRWKSLLNETDKLMEEIISYILGQSTYLMSFTNDGTIQGEFLIECNGIVDMSIERYFEKIGKFTVKDIVTTEPLKIQYGIKPMVIQNETEIVKEIED
jgi:hypothetical protein